MTATNRCPSGIYEEFKTVDLLVDSSCSTSTVDAFIIAWVKSERQVRKIFSYLVYQSPIFPEISGSEITNLLAKQNNIYSDDFIKGFNSLYKKKYEEIIGERYKSLYENHKNQNKIRNKIIHGQLTGNNLKREQLKEEIMTIKEWCSLVAEKMNAEIGYDGFIRNSLQKSSNDLTLQCKIVFTQLNDLKKFINQLHK